jgi:nucleotide-binding universal stress UspA family protein
MKPIATILCAVDRSETSQRALSYATTIAAGHGARMHVLEVSETEAPEADTAALRQLVEPAVAAGVVVDVHVRHGRAAHEILEEAQDRAVDLIVLGSRGRHAFERLVLGSVTSRILHTSTCPVLVVPPGAPRLPHDRFKVIVCPTDFSAAGNAASTFARRMAVPVDATLLVLMHVVEWPFGEATGDDAVSELRRSLESQAREQLDHLAATQSLVTPAPEVRTIVAVGKPSREICAVARAEHADLIVVGVTGRGAIDLAILGSTTHQVVRQAHCPVVAVPHQAGPA